MIKKYEPRLGLEHSKLFDVHRWSEYPEVNKFINKVFASLDFSEVGKDKTAKHNLKVVLLDLYVKWIEDPDLVTAFSRTHSDYKAKSRYNELHISKKVIRVVDILESVGLLHQAKGFYNRGQNDGYPKGMGKLSRIWPSYALREMFEECRINPQTIANHPERETVILRGRKRKLIEYEDNRATRDMRSFLRRFNIFLQKSDISHPRHGYRSSFTRCIFNRGHWDEGGRFYNDWQNITSKERSEFLLNGEPTVEIDYSAIHPYLLYAERGLESPWTLMDVLFEDPYDHKDFSRAQMKTMFLVMLNCERESQALRAYKDPVTGKRPLPFVETRPILEAIKEKHSEIRDAFCSDQGIKLMWKDDQIAKGVMERFLEANKPILPIHDSFVVQASQAEFLKDAMYHSLREVVDDDAVLGPTGLPPIKVIMSDEARPYLPPGFASIGDSNEYTTVLRILWPRVT